MVLKRQNAPFTMTLYIASLFLSTLQYTRPVKRDSFRCTLKIVPIFLKLTSLTSLAYRVRCHSIFGTYVRIMSHRLFIVHYKTSFVLDAAEEEALKSYLSIFERGKLNLDQLLNS